jgi:hypothetical protein
MTAMLSSQNVDQGSTLTDTFNIDDPRKALKFKKAKL